MHRPTRSALSGPPTNTVASFLQFPIPDAVKSAFSQVSRYAGAALLAFALAVPILYFNNRYQRQHSSLSHFSATDLIGTTLLFPARFNLMRTFSIQTLGCKVNQYETEQIAQLLLIQFSDALTHILRQHEIEKRLKL